MCKDGENLASCIKTLSEESVSGATHIYYHSSNLPLSAADNSYRYAGSSESVNNFVCFGSTAIPCPMDNLYRIIGVIDGQVKLIKHNYASSTLLGTDGDYYRDIRYYWNYVATKDSSNGYGLNSWDTSLLNKTNLNTNFINNIGTEWANKISNSTWKVSGYNFWD